MTDRLRFFAEECDTLQGIQVLVDSDSVLRPQQSRLWSVVPNSIVSQGFAGLASEYLAEVRDDYRCPVRGSIASLAVSRFRGLCLGSVLGWLRHLARRGLIRRPFVRTNRSSRSPTSTTSRRLKTRRSG